MVELYGRRWTRRDVAAHAGDSTQFFGVRLMTLGDGLERGVRMLEFRTGGGLRFTVMVDRGFDVGDCEHNGRSVGWHSAAGFPHPGLHEAEGEGGLGWLRGFSGLLATCGLDHFGFMEQEDASRYRYPPRTHTDFTLHGRVAMLPARLLGYGEVWDGDECTLYAEGEVRQAAVFAEHLVLVRRIEARVGTDGFTIHDRVVNRGFARTPHMLCYHINVGHPALAEGSRYLAPVENVVWASHAHRMRDQGIGYRALPGPQPAFVEQVWEHIMAADADGLTPVAVVNDAIGFGFQIETRRTELPVALQWQNFQANGYCMGIEPATNHVKGNGFARDRGELIELEYGEDRRYTLACTVLPDSAAIAAAERRIRAIGPQPDEDFPEPTGRWDDLRALRT